MNHKPNKISYIAFLGPKGSYSHIAAMQYARYCWNQIIKYYSCKKFDEIFTSIEKNLVKYGVIPIENSSSGLIDETFNLLLHTQLKLVAEITIPIQHCILVNNCTILLNQIQIIYSHPQPAQQCSKFLKNFSTWKIILCESSASAIKKVAQLNQSHLAALGSIQGGTFYGLRPLISENLSNCQKNLTKFIILKKKNKNKEVIKTAISKKIMIIISINRTVKTLYSIFEILKIYNITVTFLKSYKFHTNNTEYLIILEFTININSYTIKRILEELRNISNKLKVLGCYPSIPLTGNIQI